MVVVMQQVLAHNVCKPVVVQQVWGHNLLQAMFEIKKTINMIRATCSSSPLVTMDTEFPGTIHKPKKHYSLVDQHERYECIKNNVNDLKLIQLGLTIYSPYHTLVYEFNFNDFDIYSDSYAEDAITLLKQQGMNFENNRRFGIRWGDFRNHILHSGLFDINRSIVWVTFHGTYDFAYMIKLLTGKKLPEKVESFLEMVKAYFGTKVYDLKHMMEFCNSDLYGGLEYTAAKLGVKRMVGKAHQSGSDSLLILHTFLKMKTSFFKGVNFDEGYGNRNMLVYSLGPEVF